jgi:uncharacterized protein (DUF1778 family)
MRKVRSTPPQSKETAMTTAATLERRAALRRKEHPSSQRRDTIINLRAPTKLRDLIDRAAAVVGKTRSDFILDTVHKHAIDVLLDQRLFSLDLKQYEEFLHVLDQPAESNARLKQLLTSKSPWE